MNESMKTEEFMQLLLERALKFEMFLHLLKNLYPLLIFNILLRIKTPPETPKIF